MKKLRLYKFKREHKKDLSNDEYLKLMKNENKITTPPPKQNDISGLERLKQGNKTFEQHFGENAYREFIEVQHPHTVVLSCSDSRVPVERLFNLPTGEIFVVREAGQFPLNNSIASIEYAIAELGVKNLLVLGHTECGAVKAAIKGELLPSNALNELVESVQEDMDETHNLDTTILNHAKSVLIKLIESSQIIRDAIANKYNTNFNVRYAVYNIKTGHVHFYKL